MSMKTAQSGRWALALMSSLFLLTACQVRQEIREIPLVRDPNLPANPAKIPQDSPAFLCSAESRFYLEFDGMAQWRAARERDPLVAHLWSAIAEIRPKGMWDGAAQSLGMDEDALTDRYFGRCMAIVGERPDTNAPYTIISRVAPEDLRVLPAAMSLRPLMPVQLGGAMVFATFTSADGSLLFATHGQWLLVGPARHREHFESTLAFAASRLRSSPSTGSAMASSLAGSLDGMAHAPTLVEADDFQKLLVKLPAGRQLLFYTRDKARKGRHAAAVMMEGSQLVAHYVGTIDKMDELYEQFEHGRQIDFGLMPQSTISAASVNLMKKDAKGLAVLNLFLFPHNVREHVLPKLAAPMIVFLGQVDGEKITPNPGVSVPAVGVAIRMKDPTVANDLNRIVGGLHFMANVGQLNLIEGVFGGRRVKSGGLEYRIADFGDALVKEIKDPEAARMFKLPDAAGLTQLTYGAIGSWFVICSQESLYHDCAAAHDNESLRFTASSAYSTFPLEMKDGLLISAVTRAPQLAAMTQELNRYWEKLEAKAKAADAPLTVTPEPVKPADADAEEVAPISGARKVRQPMEWIANAIKHRDSFYMQVWRDGDGDLRGMLSTVAPPRGTSPHEVEIPSGDKAGR